MADERDARALNEETRAAWDRNAAFWDERMGEGNLFQRRLVAPAVERLLQIRPDERVLEIACGNGVMARRLAALGASVLATDFSSEMIERARARPTPHADRIEYRMLDATQQDRLAALGERAFDALVCNMAIMDMADVRPLMSAAPRLLQPGGRFVFTIMHPCFNSSGTTLNVEETDREGEIVTTYSVRVYQYNRVGTRKGLAIIGQPAPQLYFHRTLAELFNLAFNAGMVVDGLEEPSFDGSESSPRALSWANFTDIPPVLAVRLRAAGARGG